MRLLFRLKQTAALGALPRDDNFSGAKGDATTITQEDQDRIRSYLLGELGEADEEQVELRLLSDAEFAEEVEIAEDELIDQYALGEIDPGEREQLERHFFDSPERRRKLRFALALKSHKAADADADANAAPGDSADGKVVPIASAIPRARRPVFPPLYLKAAAGVLVAFGIGLSLWLLLPARGADIKKGTDALREAYKSERLVEPRVTALYYAPFVVTRGQEKPRVDYAARDTAEGLLRQAVETHHDARSYHALGRAYLAAGQLDQAVEQFEKSLAAGAGGAEVHSDMGAALLEQGRQAALSEESGEALSLLSRSLTHIDEALRLAPGFPEALYNRALCLQRMMAPAQAEEAWRLYLAREPQSPWAGEAQRNLQKLLERGHSTPTAARLLEEFLAAYRAGDDARAWQVMSRNRELITGRMITRQLARDYVTQAAAGGDDAPETLRALVFAGGLDLRMGGDPYTAELASYYAAATPARLRLLARAVEDLDAGYKLCLATSYGEAERRFDSARRSFDAAGDVWEANLADYWIAYCLTQADRTAESNARLSAVAESCEKRGHKWLLAQACGWLAVNHTKTSEYSSAIEYQRRSLALAEEIADTYQTQKALMELGDLYGRLQQARLSLDYHHRSLALAFAADAGPRQSCRNFSAAGAALFGFRHYAAAAALTNEALRLATTAFDDPSLAYTLRLNLGQIYAKLGLFSEAAAQADLGLRAAASTRDAQARRKLTANAILKQAHIWRESGDCARAAARYGEAISLYEAMQFDFHRYAAYKGRLLCARDLGDEDSVGRDLAVLLQLIDRHRKQIREEQNRNTFFDTEQAVYDIAVEYERDKGDDLGALNYAEAGRARSLLDALRPGTRFETAASPETPLSRLSGTTDLGGVGKLVPPQVRVLMYTVLPKKLLIWSISREGSSVTEKKIGAEELEADVTAYVNALSGGRGGAGTEALGSKLFTALVGDAVGELGAREKLCIIPDKFLHRLPFAALISPASGHYLVEEAAVFYAPSLSVLWECTQAARGKTGGAGDAVLSVGNPTFDRRAHPDLQQLEDSGREAREVAALYGGRSTCLTGRGAKKERLLREMTSAEIIHFAGHYVLNGSSPQLSKMLLADAGTSPRQGSPDLSALEISGINFDRTKLVVLSACQTGLDRYYDGEGAVGLARAFLEGRVPLVVASQWAVDSDASAALMIDFHRNRRAGIDTFEALRQAQVAMLRGNDEAHRSPYYWAAFLCVGGFVEY